MLYLEPATRDLFPAPICKHSKETIRLYDNTCRCARGPTAVDTSRRGLVRGNCTGLDEDTDDNLSKVWCFLENVRDPLNPQSGCYSDVTWSEKDGRFWSSIACYEVKRILTKKITSTFFCQAPDIEGGAIRAPSFEVITQRHRFETITERKTQAPTFAPAVTPKGN